MCPAVAGSSGQSQPLLSERGGGGLEGDDVMHRSSCRVKKKKKQQENERDSGRSVQLHLDCEPMR